MSSNRNSEITNTGCMKLVFVATKFNCQAEHFLELVRNCIQKLNDTLDCPRATVTFESPTQIGTSNENCRIDCVVKVRGTPLWLCFSVLSSQLASTMKKFAAENSTEQLQFQTSVQIQDRAFFDIGQLNGADLEINAEEVFFGNLIKHDTFISHYIVDNDTNNGWYGTADHMQYYFNRDPVLKTSARPTANRKNPTESNSMFVDFEHDRRRLFIIFPILWPDNFKDDNKRGGNEKVPGVAKLQVGYNTIRRIFCDFERQDQIDQTLNLYLHLKSPPLISILKFARRDEKGKKTDQLQSDLRTKPGDRYKHWLPLNTPDHKEAIRAVAESPYLKIKFRKDIMQKFIHIIGRLFAASQRPIEIRNIVPYSKTAVTCKYLQSPLNDNNLRNKLLLSKKSSREREDFAVTYMLDALLSRGAHVKDQLLVLEEHRSSFIKRLIELYSDPNNRRLTLESLERLLNTVDELLDMRPLHELFDESIEKARRQLESEDPEKALDKRGYVRLRKVTITPTRFIYEAPELIMGNRVLRADLDSFPAERFLRVAFRDDDWTRIRSNTGAKFIESFVKNALYNGIVVADYYHLVDGQRRHRVFNYLGSSNSQMREQGCYFIQANDDEIKKFRESLGAFKLESVPKLMARFGQCFTQSQVTDKILKRERYNFAVEYTGGADSQGKEYNFSDGVGCMSMRFAREISRQMKLGDFLPSCIQARFRGFKGVNSVNPNMDRLREWADKHGLKEPSERQDSHVYNIDLLFRGSQCKFKAPANNQRYEVVKLSGPSPVALNRPMINIMDQVSAMQGFDCHRTVTNRIFQLLDLQLQQIARTMTEETAARSRLGEFPRVVMFDVLQNLNLTQEPFFRAMLRMAARCTLKKLRAKQQIAIPGNLGRSMLGIVDETGLLSYGQVFVRYTVNMQQKRPGPAAARITHTGKVLITKNPMIVAGDVRMFEAVDIPALNHLCDVVVFPRNGPRPHPDEMAGSDLDGDEYSVIWDPQLFLNRNEAAFDYTPDKTIPDPVNEENLRKQMADFFVKYISHDSIGTLATAFLVNSDIYGIESEVCEIVAKKHMQAVDFPKTGQPPEKLKKPDPRNNQTGEEPQRKPDFNEQYYKPTYLSPRLNGRLFRRIKAIDDVLEISIEDQLNQPGKPDETFYVDGVSENYMEVARDNFYSYKATLENLLQRFGINSEVEIFSNSYSVMRKRISDKEEDDFSFFNTQRIIEEEIENIYSTHRKRLFETFGETSFHEQTEWPYKTPARNERETRLILRKVARQPSKALQRLAVAYYRVAYSQGDQKFLSFAWLGADVLAHVRQSRVYQLRQDIQKKYAPGQNVTMPANYTFSFDPLSIRVHQHILKYVESRKNDYKTFRDKLKFWHKVKKDKEAFAHMRAYCERHKGLEELLFFCYMWARRNDLLADEPQRTPVARRQLKLQPGGVPAYSCAKIALTFIQFGLDCFDKVRTPNKPFLEETKFVDLDDGGHEMFSDPDKIHEFLDKREDDYEKGLKKVEEPLIDSKLVNEVNLLEQHGGLGCKFLQFLRFCSSLDFAQMKRQSFVDFCLYSSFCTQQHVRLHKAAESSYYKLCFTDDFSTLPYSKTKQAHVIPPDTSDINLRPAIDGESFVFELPAEGRGRLIQNNKRVMELTKKTGVDDVFIRSLPFRVSSDMTCQFVVTVAGSLESVNSLRRMLAPTGYINCPMSEVMLSNALASQVFHRLLQICPADDEESKVLSKRTPRRRLNGA